MNNIKILSDKYGDQTFFRLDKFEIDLGNIRAFAHWLCVVPFFITFFSENHLFIAQIGPVRSNKNDGRRIEVKRHGASSSSDGCMAVVSPTDFSDTALNTI